MVVCGCLFFLCEQMTSYEMRISDWSPDVCSSDLRDVDAGSPVKAAEAVEGGVERQPADDAGRMRIGKRRAIAVEIRQDMQIGGKPVAVLGQQVSDRTSVV